MKFIRGKVVFDSVYERCRFLDAWGIAVQQTKEKTGLTHEQEVGIGMFRVTLVGYRKKR